MAAVSKASSIGWVHTLDHEQMAEIHRVFEFFAEKIDGYNEVYTEAQKKALLISHKSIKELFGQMGLSLTAMEARQLLSVHCAPGSNGMTYDEFMVFYAKLNRKWGPVAEMKEAFRLLDDDSDGYVEISKLRCILIAMDDEKRTDPINAAKRVDQMLRSAYPFIATQSSGRDFKITYDQFVHFLYA